CKLLAVGNYTASGNSLLAVGMPCAFYSQQRSQEYKTRNQETTRRTVNVANTSSKAMVAINGAGFD
nr:hypothetical protein [Tanacetum cinerariifolium]